MRTALFFKDLVILDVIRANSDEKAGAYFTRMNERANEWIDSRNVPINYSSHFTSDERLQHMLNNMIEVDLIEHVGLRKGYRLTDKAHKLFEDIGEEWKAWFLAVPVDKDGSVLLDQAKYAMDYRTEI